MNDGPNLSIVIPTLNRIDTLEKCLRSIECFTETSYEVIVHANCCSRETTELLRRFDFVRGIESEDNLFFTQAVNRGIASARGRYVFLMNDDCVVTTAGWTDFYITLLESDPKVGVVGPHWWNIDELPYGWIEPYASMYRRSLFQELGPLPYFDDSFRLWWSDIYHAYRLMHRGYYLLPLERTLADSIVEHARPAGADGQTVIKMRSHLPAECFEFHGKRLMYERLGIADEADLVGYYGDRIWTREQIAELVDLPGRSDSRASGRRS
jgi:GT2 family glycosyltransferase